MPASRRRTAVALAVVLGICSCILPAPVETSAQADTSPAPPGPPPSQSRGGPVRQPAPAELTSLGWVWPVTGFRLLTPYIVPAHRYGPGHRGVDLAMFGASDVHSPAAGTVLFVGDVVDRPLITLDHGGGLVSTLEPVTALVAAGDIVVRGQTIGVRADGGHSPAGSIHFGVRRDGEYINPILLLGGVPRAVLLPCCE